MADRVIIPFQAVALDNQLVNPGLQLVCFVYACLLNNFGCGWAKRAVVRVRLIGIKWGRWGKAGGNKPVQKWSLLK